MWSCGAPEKLLVFLVKPILAECSSTIHDLRFTIYGFLRFTIYEVFGGQGRNRTADAGLFRAALYQLSYLANRVGKTA